MSILALVLACNSPAGSWASEKDTTPMAFVQPLDETAQGHAGGSAVSLFRTTLGAESVLTVKATRTSGDLEPQVYLFEGSLDGINDPTAFEPPAQYAYGEGEIELTWEVALAGVHFFVVRGHEGTAGDFALTLMCIEGECVEGDTGTE